MRSHYPNCRPSHLPAWVTALALLTAHGAIASPIAGDTIAGDLTVTGWGGFANGVDIGRNGELSINWLAADSAAPLGTASFDIVGTQGAFLWRDTITATPAARNKMRLDPSNTLTLYMSDGTAGFVLDPENGKCSVLGTGPNSGIFFGTNTLPTLKAATNGAATFPAQAIFQNGLQLTNGILRVSTATPATSSATGALLVAGGLGVAMDSYVNGVRIGRGAGNNSTNTAAGSSALNYNTSGSFNTAIGTSTLYANTTGSYNTATGCSALQLNTTGLFNTATGAQSLRLNTTGNVNTALGSCALNRNTTGGWNTASGASALLGNTTGSCNVALGAQAMLTNTTGYYNTAVGCYALYMNSTSTGNAVLGYQAALNNTTGSNNVTLGIYAAILQANGTPLSHPESSIYIGAYVRGKDDNDSNSIVIGAKAIGEGVNTTVIGNSMTTRTHLYGELVATTATVGGYPVLATRAGTNAVLTNSAALALGSYAGATQSGAIAIGQYAQATMNSALALGDSAHATGSFATAIQQADAVGTYAFAANLGYAGGDYSLAMTGGRALGVASIALGGFAADPAQANTAIGVGSVALGGQANAANGPYCYAMGSRVTAGAAYSFALGAQNLSAGLAAPGVEQTSWLEPSILLEIGNGNPEAPGFETSNAITTLKNGQTTLTNKAWKAAPSDPLADPAPTTDSEGNALVVEGHTVLKGKVIIEQAQGDISMGIYGGN
jgi:hypothetical protein